MKYIPAFREIYYDEYRNHTGVWFLLSDLKKLKTPIQCLYGKEFRYLSDSRPVMIKGSHLRLNCFVSVFPKIHSQSLFEPEPKELQDSHLKDWLIQESKGKDTGFHESNIQDAILVDLLSKGYMFSKEGVIKEGKSKFQGRYDFLVKKKDKYFAIETKLNDDTNAPSQLEDYIDAIVDEGEIKRENIEGIIICGRASEKTIREAKKRDFGVYEYKLDLNIPNFLP